MPSFRDLAVQLRINPNTVAKVYQLLETEGIVKIHKGKGVFIAAKDITITKKERSRIVTEKIDEAIIEAFQFDMDEKTVKKLVDDRFGFFKKQQRKT